VKYSIECLIKRHESGERLKYLFFWGHQPSKDGSIQKSCFSQWWGGHPFVYEEIEYLTTEHWMMAQKARLFEDEKTLQKILVAKTAAEAKKLGREVQNFVENQWKKERFEIVKKGNLLKFGQHEDLKSFLLNTKDRILVEASPVDHIWGIALAADDPAASFPQKWKGLNLLGFALMEVRDELNQ
jgi:ribA/ribD-fused uncharacterized protein